MTGVFRPLVRAVGLVGVPGEGLEAGLTPTMEAQTTHRRCFGNSSFYFGSSFPQRRLQQSSSERLTEPTETEPYLLSSNLFTFILRQLKH